MEELLLGVDIGTSACKVALFDGNGKIAAQANEEYPTFYGELGMAEQNPNDWWNAVCAAIRSMLAKNESYAARIVGIGVDGQSWSAVAVDDEGEPLCPTPIWMDTRAADICADWKNEIGSDAIFELCGNPIQPSYTTPKIRWYKEYRSGIFSKMRRILQCNSFIVCKLTDAVTQDLSQGYGLHFFDMRKGIWDADMAKAMGIDLRLMPPLYACNDVVGRVTPRASAQTGLPAGIPVVAGGLDAACGTLGAGVLRDGQTQDQGGQAAGMSVCLKEYAAHPKLILSYHVVPHRRLLQGGTVGGGSLKWLREKFLPNLSFETMSAYAETICAGADGLVFLPYMAGERSPLWNPCAKGVFFGLDYSKGQAHMIRAVMEGVAFSLRHNLETAGETGTAIETLNAMGGAANSSVWTQIKSDITGKEIKAVPGDAATTLGAAILAGVGVGMWRSFEEAVAQTVRVTRTHSPNEKNRAVYDRQYKIYRELYENTKACGHSCD